MCGLGSPDVKQREIDRRYDIWRGGMRETYIRMYFCIIEYASLGILSTPIYGVWSGSVEPSKCTFSEDSSYKTTFGEGIWNVCTVNTTMTDVYWGVDILLRTISVEAYLCPQCILW